MSRNEERNASVLERTQENPRPALIWLLGALVLFALEAGAVVHFLTGLFGSPVSVTLYRSDLPPLLDRMDIPVVFDGDIHWSDELRARFT